MSPPTHKPRVLIVDDEFQIVTMFARLFNNGWDVTAESDPKRARALLLGPSEFDVILMDVVMPDLNGFELYEELSTARKRRIIFITAAPLLVESFFESHNCAWLEKPFIGAHRQRLEAFVNMLHAADFPRGP